MLVEVKPTRVCGWPVHIIYTAYHSTFPYLGLGHILVLVHMDSIGGGLWWFLRVSFGGNWIQNSSTSQLLSPWRQPDVVQRTSPPLHRQASPEGRVKRHLLPFPPAAAENNQGETKNQATQRRCRETVPKGLSNSGHIHTVCTHCPVLSIKLMSPSNLCPLRCSLIDHLKSTRISSPAFHSSIMGAFKAVAIKAAGSGYNSSAHSSLEMMTVCTICLWVQQLNPIWGQPPCHEKVIKIHRHFTGL